MQVVPAVRAWSTVKIAGAPRAGARADGRCERGRGCRRERNTGRIARSGKIAGNPARIVATCHQPSKPTCCKANDAASTKQLFLGCPFTQRWLRGLSRCFNVRDRYESPGIKNGERARVANVWVTDRWDALLGDIRMATIGNRKLTGGG